MATLTHTARTIHTKHCPHCNTPMALVKARWICGDSAACATIASATGDELRDELTRIQTRRDYLLDGANTPTRRRRLDALNRRANEVFDALNYADAPNSIIYTE